MALANLSNKIRLFINEIDYSDYLIAGSTSDDSSYSSHIVTTTGEVVIGSDPSLIDYNKTLFPIGSKVTLYATLDNGKVAKLPRGHLFVLNSSINIAERTTTLEVGCSLAYLSAREGNYTTYVEDLFDTFLSSELKDSFVIDNYNLSTLESLLEIDGRVIYQDRWGYVQAIDLFGNDGQGSNIKDAKLTCFDKHSSINIESLGGSIEDIPSSILVEAEFDAPITTTQSVSGTDYYPPPYVTDQTLRLIKRLDAEYVGNFYPENLPEDGSATTEANAVAFLSRNTTLQKPPKYGYTITGEAYSLERVVRETVTNQRAVEYRGPGNQVSWEYTAEVCSALTYAKSLIDGVLNKYVATVNQEIQRANSMLSKANQAFATRDDYAGRDLAGVSAFTSNQVQDLYGYNASIATQYYTAAEYMGGGAESMMTDAQGFVDTYVGKYGVSNATSTFNTYGSSGELVKKVVKKYIHESQSLKAQAALDALQITYLSQSPVLDTELQYRYRPSINFAPFGDAFGRSFNSVVQGQVFNPTKSIGGSSGLIQKSETVTRYFYGTNWSKEVETYTDFEDPVNNYKKTSWSSSGSKNAPSEDRIIIERDINGCVYLTDDNSESDTRTIQYLQEIDIANPLGTPSIPAGWLGQATATQKTVQLPLSFAPIRAKSCNGVITYPNLAEKVNIYNKIIQKYASNLAKKYTADNFGYRISEKGIRAEIFDYYPFFPVSLSLASLSKNYKLRVASSTWVFDSNNVLCSFDCYNVGDIEPASSTQIVTPYIYIAFKKVDGSVTLDSQFFNVPETTSYIEILNLPTTGSVYLSGVLVSVGDTITVAAINANNVTFTPSTSGTVEIGVAYEAYDSSNERINSDYGIYPNLQSAYSGGAVTLDGGEFTLNTTNGGDNTDAGNFDTGVANTIGSHANAGDFDTGTTVQSFEPAAPSGASTSNGSVDPEATLGLNVLDAANNSISTYKLPTPKGNVSPTFEVAADFRVISAVYLNLDLSIILQDGWDYGAIEVGSGTTIDFGTIVDPNTYGINFGTIAAPVEPTIASSVV